MKRFTETTKWQDPWYRRLPPRLKCLWQHLLDNCDPAGVIDPDWELIGFQIGEDVSAADVASFDGRVELLKSGKLWITKFIEFQYGELSEDCKAHTPVFKAISLHRLERVSNGYPKGIHTLKDKDKDKERDRSAEERVEISFACRESDFDAFWSAYPKKAGKEKAIKAWKAMAKKRPPIEQILAKLEAQKRTHDWQKEGGQFIPYPATWLNQGRWDDEAELALAPAANPKPAFDHDAAVAWAQKHAPHLAVVPFEDWHPGYQQDFFKANGR